ncbi:MAG TPA: GNAT family N-acetyltransferase [Elusimicrobiota bacterium]|nr:GNAT family N-acetyltransferase [Elusimicrobiota bacterium]
MEIKVHTTIEAVPKDDWNGIVGPNRLICTHEYLSAIERSGINDCRFFYPAAYEGGRLVAHTCAYTISTELDLFATGVLKKAIGRVRRFWPDFLILRSLECGTPVALGSTFSFREGTDRAAALGALRAAIEGIAEREGINVILFRDFLDRELPFYDSLLSFGYRRIHNLPGTRIDVTWKTFDQYLDSLRKRYRKEISLRKRKFQRDDVTVQVVEDFTPHAADLERLWFNVYDQAREYKRERLTKDFFMNIRQCLNGRSSVLLVKKGDRPVAFSLLLFDDETLIPLFCGLDYSLNEDYCLYFNLFYNIIALAGERDMRDIDLGITTLEPKKEIGAEVVTLHMYMKHRNPLFHLFVPRIFDAMTPQDNTPPKRVFKTDPETAHD